VTKIIFFILTCYNCNLTEITYKKSPYVDCFVAGNAYMSQLEYKEGNDDMRSGHYTKSGALVLGYRCE
jgi:hypothetical protein